MEESWSGLAPCSAASWPPTAWSMPPPSQREAAPQTRVRHASACPSIRGVPLVSVHARHRQLRMQHACTTGRPCEPISGGSGQGVAVGANPPIGLRRGSHSRPRDENLTAGARSRRARTHALACRGARTAETEQCRPVVSRPPWSSCRPVQGPARRLSAGHLQLQYEVLPKSYISYERQGCDTW